MTENTAYTCKNCTARGSCPFFDKDADDCAYEEMANLTKIPDKKEC